MYLEGHLKRGTFKEIQYVTNLKKKEKKSRASPHRKLVPYADRAKERGIKVYHLNIGQPDIATPEVALKAVRQMKLPVIEYTASAGNHTLRTKLAGYYQKLGILPDRRRHTDYYRVARKPFCLLS